MMFMKCHNYFILFGIDSEMAYVTSLRLTSSLLQCSYYSKQCGRGVRSNSGVRSNYPYPMTTPTTPTTPQQTPCHTPNFSIEISSL